jgi:hypothetical protein
MSYSSYGFLTNRDEVLVSIDKEPLVQRMSEYFDSKVTDAQIAKRFPALMRDTGRFEAKETREALLKRGFESGEVVRLHYRPFDVRWLYWHSETKLNEERRAEFRPHVFPGNLLLAVVRHNRKGYTEPMVVTCFPSHHLIERGANYFPLYLNPVEPAADQAHPDLFAPAKPSGPQPNLTDYAREYLAGLKCGAEDLFFHIVAVLHAPLYREENAGALRQDWPRVPLPSKADTLKAGADLGREIATLLDPETTVPGVTDLKPRAELRGLGELGVAKDSKTPDLAVRARWGYAGQGGVTMPGPGKVTDGSRGEGFLDIHLNETTRWKDVPVAVWDYTLGGYQVLKKWLSYREESLLKRPLSSDEAEQFTHHVRRIAAILELSPQLDAHYRDSASQLQET